MASVKELQSQITSAFTEQRLKELGVPDEDVGIFKNYKLFPIDLLVKADWNYKEEDESKSEKLRNNMKRIGQVENVHVRKLDTGYYEVLNGNHRLDDLNSLDKKFVFAFDHGDVSREEAIRRAIETNETKFKSETLKLAELIGELGGEFDKSDILTTMPFSEDEWEEFEELLDFDFNDFEKDGEVDDDPTYKVLTFDVPTEVYEMWQEWKQRCERELGYESDWKAFEFAIVEANQIPEESLEGSA